MSIKDLSVEDILSSKVYVKSNSSVSFGTPKEYLEPFIEPIKANTEFSSSFRVKVADPVVNAEDSGAMNIAYPRVMIEADLGELIPGFKSIVGLIMALDLQKPVMKVYSGYNVSSCLNLTIFNADKIYQQEILGDYQRVYAKAKEFFEKKADELVEFKETLAKLQTTFLSEIQLNELIGKMIRESAKLRLGTTPILQATKLLDDNSSQYYIKPDGKFTCSKFNVYNAVTQSITNSNDIVDRATKTIQLSNLILN
ncbi:hypothetical protein [Immundisolibacter sp.]